MSARSPRPPARSRVACQRASIVAAAPPIRMPYGPVNPNSIATSPAIALGAVYGKCNVPLDATEPARFSLRPPSDEACLTDSATTEPARFSLRPPSDEACLTDSATTEPARFSLTPPPGAASLADPATHNPAALPPPP